MFYIPFSGQWDSAVTELGPTVHWEKEPYNSLKHTPHSVFSGIHRWFVTCAPTSRVAQHPQQLKMSQRNFNLAIRKSLLHRNPNSWSPIHSKPIHASNVTPFSELTQSYWCISAAIALAPSTSVTSVRKGSTTFPVYQITNKHIWAKVASPAAGVKRRLSRRRSRRQHGCSISSCVRCAIRPLALRHCCCDTCRRTRQRGWSLATAAASVTRPSQVTPTVLVLTNHWAVLTVLIHEYSKSEHTWNKPE